jgi:hypothetical protein
MPDDAGKAETNYKLSTSSALYQRVDRADGSQKNEYGRMIEPMRVGRSDSRQYPSFLTGGVTSLACSRRVLFARPTSESVTSRR